MLDVFEVGDVEVGLQRDDRSRKEAVPGRSHGEVVQCRRRENGQVGVRFDQSAVRASDNPNCKLVLLLLTMRLAIE